jgi:NAD/NADP transhydrogenase alpha subunit
MIALGAGVAGLQAIATARRLKPVFKKGTRLRPTVTSAVMADTAPVCRIQEFRQKLCA